jgi:hypothetical protein
VKRRRIDRDRMLRQGEAIAAPLDRDVKIVARTE